MKIKNLIQGDSVEFESIEELRAALEELNKLNPNEHYGVPVDGLKEGRDYIIIED